MAHCDDRAKERCRRDNTEDNRRREEDVKKMRKNKREQIFTGRFDSNARGFGFVTVEGFERDLFIPQGCTGGAVYGDTVEVRITRGSLDESGRGDDGQGKRAEAEVTRILVTSASALLPCPSSPRPYSSMLPLVILTSTVSP